MPQTVFVTGATGYVAKHVVLQLLDAGHTVIGSTRAPEREAELRAALGPHLQTPGTIDNLSVTALDLTRDDGWADAVSGADALIHTASPFPMSQPKDEEDLIRPAIDGTRRALTAARDAGVTRVVLTSSVVAIGQAVTPARGHFDETDWSDLTHPTASPYAKSKTLAEQAAWDFAGEHPELQLTTINPGLIIGPPLDAHFGTSIKIVERLLKGSDPMLPNMGFSVVDVRDVAKMHVDALTAPESVGKRLIAVADSIWFRDIAQTLVDAYPDRKIATRVAPDVVMRGLALFDKSIKSIVPELGRCPKFSTRLSREVLGMDFRDPETSIRETAAYLVDNGLV
ncbi:dihydroflavonol-4-reductase [Litoreibacter ponti]|uniref:Dihydroflavonol-4-reductase n=1 Tax=Litoreibacter ponti TaxID=1510457 RepID=A0A2T6BMI4_9RHOB|nr:aldehyde reductase [Litoreibacter ponti]PTX57290.1 dihydroflavonol-4-reductase [Litoreibacter ponti]